MPLRQSLLIYEALKRARLSLNTSNSKRQRCGPPLTSSQWHRRFWEAAGPAGSCPPLSPRKAGGGRWYTVSLCRADVAAVGGQHPPRWPSWCARKTPFCFLGKNNSSLQNFCCGFKITSSTLERKWKQDPCALSRLATTADALVLLADKESINSPFFCT